LFDTSAYNLVILSLAGGLISLLGSVGIFVSLIIQRRVERLQEILEELVDLSYQTEQNLTSNIYRLIQKYQMYYILPHGPSKTIMRYLDFTMALVIISWLGLLILTFKPPFQYRALLHVLPILGGLSLMIYYRKLLQNAINPLENQMLNAIIPPPVQLRSVSFLSRYVNVSVRSLLQQARLRVVFRKVKRGKSSGQTCYDAEIVLKEELSFDDFFYYFSFPLQKKPHTLKHFVAFGHLQLLFPPDPVTGKPVPVVRNVNITLGWCNWGDLPPVEVEARLLIFPLGEKHPIAYRFKLLEEKSYYAPQTDYTMAVDRGIMFTVDDGHIVIIEGEERLPAYELAKDWFQLNLGRRYFDPEISQKEPVECTTEVYIK
jgi:hypothetical protein